MTDRVVTASAIPSLRAIAGAVAARTVLYTVLWLLAWFAVPVVVLGWQPVVVSGNSMQPNIRPGDAVLVRPGVGEEPLEPGTIVTFRRTLDERVVTHRIAEVLDAENYLTKGDANDQPDSDPVSSRQVIGVARLVIPMVAILAVDPSDPVPWLVLGALAALVLGGRPRRERRARAPRPVRQPAPVPAPRPAVAAMVPSPDPVAMDRWTAHPVESASHRPRAVVAVALLAVVQLLALPAPVAQASFTEATRNTGSRWTNGVIENPTNLALTFTNVLCTVRSMGLTWTRSPDPDVTSQLIYRTAGAGPRTLLATKATVATTHTDLTVNCGVTYVYEIVAVAAYSGTTWTSAVVVGQNRQSITT